MFDDADMTRAGLALSIDDVARQRMLAHKVLMCISLSTANPSAEGPRAALGDAIARFRDGHQAFLAMRAEICGEASPFRADCATIDAFADWVDALARDGADISADEIERRALNELPSLIAALNRVIARMEQMAEDAAGAREQAERESRSFVAAIAQDLQDIGGKINLIALNARIEAARQNDEGRAFAVIATEIKSLSDLSRRKADEIARRLDALGA